MWIFLILAFFGYRYREYIYNYLLLQLQQLLVETHHKYYIIYYPYGLRWYAIKVPRKRGPTQVNYIHSNLNDVTERVSSFMGPGENFHGNKFTPIQLGYNELTFVLEDSEKTFISNEEINF